MALEESESQIYPIFFLFFFQGLHHLHQASFLQWEEECLWLEIDHLETKGL